MKQLSKKAIKEQLLALKWPPSKTVIKRVVNYVCWEKDTWDSFINLHPKIIADNIQEYINKGRDYYDSAFILNPTLYLVDPIFIEYVTGIIESKTKNRIYQLTEWGKAPIYQLKEISHQ